MGFGAACLHLGPQTWTQTHILCFYCGKHCAPFAVLLSLPVDIFSAVCKLGNKCGWLFVSVLLDLSWVYPVPPLSLQDQLHPLQPCWDNGWMEIWHMNGCNLDIQTVPQSAYPVLLYKEWDFFETDFNRILLSSAPTNSFPYFRNHCETEKMFSDRAEWSLQTTWGSC